MGAEAPQWLFGSFADSMQEIGATATVPELEAEARELVARWSDPARHLHNTRHLIHVLAHIDELASTAHDPDILRIAAWYHGASLNRCLSIKLSDTDPRTAAGACIAGAKERLGALGVSEDVIERVAELLSFLARHRAPRTDLDAQVLVDADLAMLAVSPQDYKKFRENLRLELGDVDEIAYLKARRIIIKKLLGFEAIYQSPLGESWEDAARANLEVELAKIDSALAKFGDVETASADADIEPDPDPSEGVIDEDVTATGTIIIKRRQLKKKNPTTEAAPDEATTGVLPRIAPEAASAAVVREDDSSSSLETAIESLDLPSALKD